MRILKVVALSAGIATGFLGLTALASSAYADSYWLGAPNAIGPDASVDANGPAPVSGPNSFYYSPHYAGGPAASGSYWLGAPRSTGPSE